MAFEAEWSLDFCLSCDKQCTEGPYCSQSCRMADLERSGSPRGFQHHKHSHSSSSSPTSASSSWSSGFHLPPAVDFATFSKPTPSQAFPTLHRSLTERVQRDSSKRNSVSSIDTYLYNSSEGRNDSTASLAESTRQQLQQYENAFDNGRHKRHQYQRSL